MGARAPQPVAVIGAGRMATALCAWLAAERIPLQAVISRRPTSARRLARRYHAGAAWNWDRYLAELGRAAAAVTLLAIPDDALAAAARAMAGARRDWRGCLVLHTSGARDASALAPLQRRGAAAGSLHPMMTFPAAAAGGGAGSVAPRGLVFTLEGDAAACRWAAQRVHAWGGNTLRLSPAAKSAYHLAATLVGPGAVVAMAAAERVLQQAGLRPAQRQQARAGLLALLEATAGNLHYGNAPAWTGPWARGDAGTAKLHRRGMKDPKLRRLYDALAQGGAEWLPTAAPASVSPTSRENVGNG